MRRMQILHKVPGTVTESPYSPTDQLKELLEWSRDKYHFQWTNGHVDDLATICIKAAEEEVSRSQENFVMALWQHEISGWIKWLWRLVTGWQPPVVFTEQQVLNDIADKLEALSEKMKTTSRERSRDCVGNDILMYAWKPDDVATILRKQN